MVHCGGCKKVFGSREELVNYKSKGVTKYRNHCPPCWASKQKEYKASKAGKKSAAKSAKSEKRKASNKRFKQSAKRAEWNQQYKDSGKHNESCKKAQAKRRRLYPLAVKQAYARWYAKSGKDYHKAWCRAARLDPMVRMQVNIGNGIRSMLRSYGAGGAPYTSSKLVLVGFNTTDELKAHFEEYFKETGMTWYNYGRDDGAHKGWVVDHIIPQKMYNPDDVEDMAHCWNHKNLRACWDIENSRKKDSMPESWLLDTVPQELWPKAWAP